MTVHFLRSCFSPFALFYSCSFVCVCTCVCECVRLCFLPLSLYSSLLCASAEIDPLLPPVSTYSQHTDQASSTWGRRECRSVCRCLCVRMCVCSIPAPALCLSPFVITLMEVRSRAVGNQSSAESNLTERHPVKGWHTVPACCSPPVVYSFAYNHVWVYFKNHIAHPVMAGADRPTYVPSILAMKGALVVFDTGVTARVRGQIVGSVEG